MTLESGSTLVISSSSVTLKTCTEATLKAKTVNQGSNIETVRAKLEVVTLNGCTRPTSAIALGEIELHHIPGSDNAVLTWKEVEITTNTLFGSCIYGPGPSWSELGTLTGGTKPKLSVNTTLHVISGPCPSEAKLTAEYTFTQPTTIYVEPA
ncbi:MAG: hypothetical protein ACTHK3_09190 [Solirubrobacterales bacterium]